MQWRRGGAGGQIHVQVLEPEGEFRGKSLEAFESRENRGKLTGEGLKIEIPSVPNGVDRRAFVVFE